MAWEIFDRPAEIDRLDSSGMAGLIAGFPNQIERSPAIVEAVDNASWPVVVGDFTSVVVLGMGGSAIGGDLARSYLAESLKIPMAVVRDYDLPNFITRQTLVIASSYSGNTEETLATVNHAQQRGCSVIAITTGGKLAQLAKTHNWPVVCLPTGLPPRAALGFSFSAILLSLGRIGLIPEASQPLQDLAAFLTTRTSRFLPNVSLALNPAKELATKIHGKTPLIYGSVGAMAVVALRWKGQFCENAKTLAFAGEAPEFNHNEICGLAGLDRGDERFIVIFLQSKTDHPRLARRFDIVRRLFEEKGIAVETIHAAGEDFLTQLFSLIQLGDWTSFYLALLNGVDPTEIKAIDYLKDKLADDGKPQR